MTQHMEKGLLLAGKLPDFSAQLRQLLVEKDELDLAAQVPSLRIFERCSCGDDVCAFFAQSPEPEGNFG